MFNKGVFGNIGLNINGMVLRFALRALVGREFPNFLQDRATFTG